MAGIAGAALWWLLRGLGVKGGLGVSSVLPLFFPATYYFVLPAWSHFQRASYQPLSTGEEEPLVGGESALPPTVSRSDSEIGKSLKVYLTPREKLDLLKPLVLRYMVPLCLVYIEEYIINSGVAPTLLFPLPTWGPWSWLFRSPRDYYPFWSLTCRLTKSADTNNRPNIRLHLPLVLVYRLATPPAPLAPSPYNTAVLRSCSSLSPSQELHLFYTRVHASCA